MHPQLDRRHKLIMGLYHQEAHAELRSTWDPLPPTAVNLRTLGIDETDTTWYLEYWYRLSENWSLVASAYKFSGQGTRGNLREFNFAGQVFPAGVELSSTLDVNTYSIDGMYRFWHNERAEASIGLGIHAFDFDTEISGRAGLITEERGETVGASDLLAPLPNLRLQGFYAFTPRLAAIADVGWFSASIDEYDGRFVYWHLRGNYLLTEHLGISLGYQVTDIDVSRDGRRRYEEYDIEFTGPTLQLTLGF